MIEDITPEEFQEVLLLAKIGKENWNPVQRKRAMELVAKATLAANLRKVVEYIEMRKTITKLTS